MPLRKTADLTRRRFPPASLLCVGPFYLYMRFLLAIGPRYDFKAATAAVRASDPNLPRMPQLEVRILF